MILGCWATQKVKILKIFPDLWGKMIETCENLGVYEKSRCFNTFLDVIFHVSHKSIRKLIIFFEILKFR